MCGQELALITPMGLFQLMVLCDSLILCSILVMLIFFIFDLLYFKK